MSSSCACSKAPKLIFSCAGAADVGEVADRAARKLHKEGAGSLFCLAGIGAGLDSFIEKTRSASKVLAIDGCPVDCAKKLLEKYGITGIEYIRVTDLGLEKGKCPVTDQTISRVADECKKVLCRDALQEVK